MPRRPRVLMVSGNAPPTIDGVGDYTRRLLDELQRQRPHWRWVWLAKRPRWFHSPISMRGTIPLLRPSHSWSAVGQSVVATMTRRVRPDLVHIQDQIHSFHETGAAVRLAEGFGGRVVTTLHEYHTELPSVVHTDALVRASNVVIANDSRNAARCLERTGRAVDHLWWSGSNVPPPRPEYRPATVPGLVATFGFLSAIKAIGTLYGALGIVRRTRPNVRWRVVGPYHPETDEHHADLARMIAGDRTWIEPTGAIMETSRLQRALAEASVMPLPFADGASTRRTTLQAAWALGIPVVTTPPPEPTEAIADGENCLLVREPTPDAWATAIGRVLDDTSLAARLRDGGLRAAERFSWPNLAARHLAIYDSLLGAGPHV